jgi:hypothetical protein
VVFRQAIEMLDPDPEPGIQFRKREHFRKLQNSVAFFFSPEEHLTNAGIRWLILVQGFDSIMAEDRGGKRGIYARIGTRRKKSWNPIPYHLSQHWRRFVGSKIRASFFTQMNNHLY